MFKCKNTYTLVFGKGSDGGIWEAFVGQELLAASACRREKAYFWIREQKGASAEVDYLLVHENSVFPLEVKGGAQGSLRALHQFLLKTASDLGFRVYSGIMDLTEQRITSPQGKVLNYRLASLPFALVFRLPDLLQDLLSQN